MYMDLKRTGLQSCLVPLFLSFTKKKEKKQMKYFIYIWKLFDTGKASKVYSCLVHSKEEYFHLTNALFFMLN